MIVIDTGPLVAAANADSKDHIACATLLYEHAGNLVVPASVVVDTCWMLARLVGVTAEATLLASIADGELYVESLHAADYRRSGEVVETYTDLGLGMVNATVVAVAERIGSRQVATLDKRDFRVVRPRHVAAFELLP
ncbi:MAG: PIN domain-containing protein [Actinomycetota bacterium]|nr:PIN domain-containing protein [Actinomycetota bacterium]